MGGEAIAPERWAAAREQARAILLPLDDNPYAQLDGRYAHLRRFDRAAITLSSARRRAAHRRLGVAG
jgi:hypothetical protein